MRRRRAQVREILPDPKYNSILVSQFVKKLMMKGKKSTAERIIYRTFDMIQEKTKNDPIEVFQKAIDNIKPDLEVKSRRVGGATYQVPIEVSTKRQTILAIRWIINYARTRAGRSMAERLTAELLDAFNKTGSAIKKREETHRMAEANKAFAHYRW